MHQNPGPATKYPCSVCTSNVTSRGVSYMCNPWSGWVHLKYSGLQNAAEYRRIKNWTCSSCSSPPTPPIPQLLPTPITSKASDGDPFTILQFNANGIGNKQVELGEFFERHQVKVAVIQESKLALNSDYYSQTGSAYTQRGHTGDFNAHHSSWYLSSTDLRGTMLESMVSGSNFGILN